MSEDRDTIRDDARDEARDEGRDLARDVARDEVRDQVHDAPYRGPERRRPPGVVLRVLLIACMLAPWAAVGGLWWQLDKENARATIAEAKLVLSIEELRDEQIQNTVDHVANTGYQERLRSCQADERERGAERAYLQRLNAPDVPDYFTEPARNCEREAELYSQRLRDAGPLAP